MALTSALYTGLSGLDVNQTRLNVVGNNIANVNTVAFKNSRALFRPQFYVTDAAGTPPSSDFGGTNPSQRGLGATVASIQKDFTQGSIQATGRSTDMALDGEGFFVLQGTSQEFTRDGTFNLNAEHQLVSAGGMFVQGFAADTNGTILSGQLANITIPLGAATSAKASTKAKLEGNLAADGAIATSGSVIESQDLTTVGGLAAPVTSGAGATSLTNIASASNPATPLFTGGQVLTLSAKRGGNPIKPQSFTVTATSTLADLQTFFNNALGIDTTAAGAGVTLPPGTAANSVKLDIAGNTGTANALTIVPGSFTDAASNTPMLFTPSTTVTATGESVHTTLTAYDSLGVPVSLDITMALQSRGNNGTVWGFTVNSPDQLDAANPGATLVGTGTVSFDTNGQMKTANGANITVRRDGTGAQPMLPIALDFSGMSSLAKTRGQASQVDVTSQDGFQLGTLDGFSVGADGIITGAFTNGQTRNLGQVATAMFNNAQGLDDKGGNLYAASANSGVPIITAPQTLGAGGVRSGALEQSNVDLSAEFINLIVASTGFNASSRVISTSNQLITELLNSSR